MTCGADTDIVIKEALTFGAFNPINEVRFIFKRKKTKAIILALALVLLIRSAGGSLLVHADKAFELPETGMSYENYPPMKEQYEDYFSFGIFGRGEIEGLIYNRSEERRVGKGGRCGGVVRLLG